MVAKLFHLGKDKRFRGIRLYFPDPQQEDEGTIFASNGIYINPGNMGNNRVHIQPRHQLNSNSGLPVPFNSDYRLSGVSVKLKKRMAELGSLLTFLVVPTWLAAIWLNIQNATDNWKANLLFGMALLFGIARLIVYAIKAKQDIRLREWEYKQKIKNKNPE